MRRGSGRLVQLSLGCLAAALGVCALSLVWLTPITGLVCFFLGTPLLAVGLIGYTTALVRELAAGRKDS